MNERSPPALGPAPVTALVEIPPMRLTMEGMKAYALMAFKSKVYKGLNSAEEALIKIQVGQEMGLPPGLALTQVYVVNGMPSFSASFIAGKIKASRPRYNYRPVEIGYEQCVLRFYEDGEEVGTFDYTTKDAQLAGLLGKGPWKQYPKSMRFSRCVTAGARIFCPDVLGVGVKLYTPEELGTNIVPPEDIIEAEYEIKKAKRED